MSTEMRQEKLLEPVDALSTLPESQPITIGTLAFERHGDGMAKSGRTRARLIAKLAARHQPDLMFCAGYAVRRTKHLQWLANRHAENRTSTHLLVEVERDDEVLALLETKANKLISPMKHAIHLVDPQGNTTRLGRQIIMLPEDFTTGTERQNKARMAALRNDINARRFNLFGFTFTILYCGEINVLQGYPPVRCRDAEIAATLKSVDVVLNPTHDMMGRYALLNGKRAWLSTRSCHAPSSPLKAYVSASNWNTKTYSGGTQNQYSDHLTTSWLNGERQVVAIIKSRDGLYDYRELTIGAR
jgi:hypothetical protein